MVTLTVVLLNHLIQAPHERSVLAQVSRVSSPKLDTISDADYQVDELEQLAPLDVDYIDASKQPQWFNKIATIFKSSDDEIKSAWTKDNAKRAPTVVSSAAHKSAASHLSRRSEDSSRASHLEPQAIGRGLQGVPELDQVTGLDLNELRRSSQSEAAAETGTEVVQTTAPPPTTTTTTSTTTLNLVRWKTKLAA